MGRQEIRFYIMLRGFPNLYKIDRYTTKLFCNIRMNLYDPSDLHYSTKNLLYRWYINLLYRIPNFEESMMMTIWCYERRNLVLEEMYGALKTTHSSDIVN